VGTLVRTHTYKTKTTTAHQERPVVFISENIAILHFALRRGLSVVAHKETARSDRTRFNEVMHQVWQAGLGLWSWEITLSSVGTVVAVVALVLYVWERVRIEPVIIRVLVRKSDDPETYLVQADLSNEGGRRVRRCSTEIQIDGNSVAQLAFVPVDSSIGRIGVDWPEQPQFTMYPHRTVPVRGYIKAPEGTRISIVLKKGEKEKNRLSFSLP